MGRWNKYSDWLPLSNAEAQVNFWIGDLASAEAYLKYVKSFKRYKLSGYKWMLNIATKDVKHSKAELAKAREKLRKTKIRVLGKA